MDDLRQLQLGMQMPTADWLLLNEKVFERPELRAFVAPFPPSYLMQVVSGLTSEADFAAHGVTIYKALQDASPEPLAGYKSILDFGCGCGRLGRMFMGHPGKITGCDIDGRLIDWINQNLPYISGVHTQPNTSLPLPNASFDAVISISVFTHLNEPSQKLYLEELQRVSAPGAYLFLTIHGDRAMERALTEERIFKMIDVSAAGLEDAAQGMREGGHNFIIQPTGHLTTEKYEYGITFIPDKYIQTVWSDYFDVVRIVSGAIHDFQDIVVCRRR
jgi:SAM-dependent methyltransferase